MRHAGGHLRGEVAAVGLLQGRACLGLLGHVHRQDVDPAMPVRCEGRSDAPGRGCIGELENRLFAAVGRLDPRRDPGQGLLPEHLAQAAPDDIGRPARQDRRQLAVGIGIDPVGIHMGDMGRHHLRREPGLRFGPGKLALGLFQCRDGRGELAVGRGQFFGARQQFLAQLLRPGAQQRLLRLHLRDVGIDRDPAAFGQR